MRKVRPRFARYSYVLLVLLPGSASSFQAEPRALEGRNIATIQFVPEQQTLEPAQIADLLPLKRNTPLRLAVVRESIQRLYATGRYEDIQVDAQPLGDQVVIRFFTKPRWFIGHVSAEGRISSPPSSGQINNAARLELGTPMTDAGMQQATAGVKKLLENNGLFQATLQPVLDYDPEGHQVHVRFVINSGPRARYTTPVFQGDLKAQPEDLVEASHWRRFLIRTWRPVTQTRTMNGLQGMRGLYQKQSRLESRVALQDMQYDTDTRRAAAHINIDAGPKIAIHAIGAKLSRKTLQQYVPIYQEHAVDHDLLVEGQRNLRDYFQSKGYFEAQVEFKEQRLINDTATIDYLINEGRRHKLVHIGIAGNKYFPAEDIRERMYMQTASFFGYRNGRYSEAYLRQDEDSISSLYQSNGFRDVKVTARVIDDYRGKAGNVAVFINVDEGPQWFVAHLELAGVEHLNRDQIQSMLSSAPGQPFSEFNVAVDRDTILEQYFGDGFASASFAWSFTPGAQPHRVDLKYTITEGRQQFVRQVLINGLTNTRPELVSKNINLNPGDPLSPTKQRDTQRRLYDLGVFAKVDTAIQNPDGDEDRKFVIYDMDEARRWSLATGFGAEITRIGNPSPFSLEAPAGTTGFAPRVSLDVSRLNLWGIGHSISFRSRVSTLEELGLINYLAPRFRNRDNLQLSFTALFDNTRNVYTFSARRLEGSAQLSWRASKATTYFYRYSYRDTTTSNLKISSFVIPLSAQAAKIGEFSTSVVQDRRDDPIDPHKGLYNTADVGLAEHILGSQTNFLRFLGRNATYYTVRKKYVLARNTTFGIVQPFRYTGSALEAIPLPERYFSGGATSDRGFPEFQAGPRDPATGFPIGGNALLMNQTEWRFPLIGANIGGVVFHDMGNVFSTVNDVSFRVSQKNLQDYNYMVHAVGFGIRYHTPIGPLRIDLAYSINPPSFFGWKGTFQQLLNAGVNPCGLPGQPTPSPNCSVQSTGHFQFFLSIGQAF